jgi:hypothetical protein
MSISMRIPTMKKLIIAVGIAGLALGSACKDENPTVGGADAPKAFDAPPVVTSFVQVEHLARPGINEAFLLTDGFNNAYNALAPSFAGAPPAALAAVVAEAKTVMKALYLGVCLLDGALGLSAADGFKPAGITCHAVGAKIWTEETLAGVTLTAASVTASQAYADKVFSQFIPDVLRIDTTGPSAYLTPCGDLSTTPLLCGGRLLNEDVIDITYNYLLSGLHPAVSGANGAYNQFTALASDGVNFSSNNAKNSGNTISSQGINNPSQYHPDILAAFPYSAAPF